MPPDRVEDCSDGRGLHQRWCAAAKEHRRDCAAGSPPRGGGDLGRERAQETRLIDTGVADVAVEIAVRALRETERPVDVDAERGVGWVASSGLRECDREISAAQGMPPQA